MAKTTKKKTVAKKATPKKTTTAKTKPASVKTKTTSLKIPTAKPSTRRPTVSPPIPQRVLDSINADLNRVKTDLDEYAAHLRALDRQRLNGVGIKKLGFIQAAYELALENPEYLPHFLTTEKFTSDIEFLISLRANQELIKQIMELNWNLVMQAADMAYTDALEFYAPVKDAAKRRVDAAESLYKTLEVFFKHKKSPNAPETEKEFMRDVKAVYRGKRDGKVGAENITPKLSGGVHKVIDETFKDKAKFKEDIEGEIQD
jgi:hypothetical protein